MLYRGSIELHGGERVTLCSSSFGWCEKNIAPREAEIEDDTVKSSEAVSALNLAHPFRVVKSLDS